MENVYPRQENKKKKLNDYLEEYLSEHKKEFSHDWSLADFWNNNKSVMYMRDFDSKWPNSIAIHDLKRKSEIHLNRRNVNRLHEVSLTFTPPMEMLFYLKPRYRFGFRRNSNALSKFSSPIRSVGLTWLRNWFHQGKAINIVSTDFISLWPFVNTIIDLNREKSSLS